MPASTSPALIFKYILIEVDSGSVSPLRLTVGGRVTGSHENQRNPLRISPCSSSTLQLSAGKSLFENVKSQCKSTGALLKLVFRFI